MAFTDPNQQITDLMYFLAHDNDSGNEWHLFDHSELNSNDESAYANIQLYAVQSDGTQTDVTFTFANDYLALHMWSDPELSNVAYFRVHDSETDEDTIITVYDEDMASTVYSMRRDHTGTIYAVFVDGTEREIGNGRLWNYLHDNQLGEEQTIELVQPTYVGERITATADVLKAIADPLDGLVTTEQKAAIDAALANLESVINQTS